MRVLTALMLVALVTIAHTAVPAASGAEPAAVGAAPAPASDRHPDLKRLSPTEEVWIDVAKKEVVVGGRIAMADGPIEVFACPEKTKEHEAVVATRSSARLIHAALLAIGLEPGSPVSFDPDYVAARGPAIAIRMRWKDAAGTVQESRAQDWIRNADTGKPLAADWVFAGSTFWKDPQDGQEYYQADGGDLVCVSNFPTATLDLPIESSQSNEALLFEAFEGRVPPRGTDVEMILSAKR
ncbi:MAG: YdjY domain-containing protein [Pirellulales bacterium]